MINARTTGWGGFHPFVKLSSYSTRRSRQLPSSRQSPSLSKHSTRSRQKKRKTPEHRERYVSESESDEFRREPLSVRDDDDVKAEVTEAMDDNDVKADVTEAMYDNEHILITDNLRLQKQLVKERKDEQRLFSRLKKVCPAIKTTLNSMDLSEGYPKLAEFCKMLENISAVRSDDDDEQDNKQNEDYESIRPMSNDIFEEIYKDNEHAHEFIHFFQLHKNSTYNLRWPKASDFENIDYMAINPDWGSVSQHLCGNECSAVVCKFIQSVLLVFATSFMFCKYPDFGRLETFIIRCVPRSCQFAHKDFTMLGGTTEIAMGQCQVMLLNLNSHDCDTPTFFPEPFDLCKPYEMPVQKLRSKEFAVFDPQVFYQLTNDMDEWTYLLYISYAKKGSDYCCLQPAIILHKIQ